MREIFTLPLLGFPEMSRRLLKISKAFQTLPKMSADIPKPMTMTFLACFDFLKTQNGTQSYASFNAFLIEISLFIMC